MTHLARNQGANRAEPPHDAHGRIPSGAGVVLQSMDEHQEIADRLRALGNAPVDPALSRTTVAAMHAAGPGARPTRRRAAIAAAALTGFLAGSFGLASAGALPDGLQDRAQSVLEHVGVDVPPGHVRYNDPVVCPGGPYKNHGEYVRTHKDDPNAGSSPCGKPVNSVDGTGSDASDSEASDAPESDDATSGNPGKGKGNGNDKAKHSDESDASDSPADTGSSTSDAPAEPESTTTSGSSASPPPETDESTASSS
ncbi:MAG: hypothetical protein QOE63_1176 [Acidimicrobiaceae bacterium]